MDTVKSDCKLKSKKSQVKIDDLENVFLFIPNIIGYFRIIFALISFYYMKTDYVKATIFYLTSSLLDAIDGYTARLFNQSTKFGSILDQLTDRMATLSLIMTLCHLYPEYLLLFQLSAVLDISSHWMYIWVSNLQGKKSHKLIDPSSSKILNLYYTSRTILFFMCASNELFYFMLYLLNFTSGPLVPIIKINLFKLILYFCAPFTLIKSFISVIHLVIASINISIIDTEDRTEKIK